MKKRVLTAILLVLYLITSTTSAFALDATGDAGQTDRPTYAIVSTPLAVNRKTIDLSSDTASVSLSVDSDSVVTSIDYYQTNSQKISIKLKSSKSIIVKVSLYDANTGGEPIAEETKELGVIFNTTWTFRGLSNDKTYYFTIENLGQIDVSVTGTVTD